MLDRSRSRDRSKTGGAFSPAGLFVTGAQGAWYDPSDFSTLYQTSTGTTPVTAVEQPVGLMLDRSRGLVLGSELITNGGFDTDLTGWTLSGTTLPVWSAAGIVLITDGSFFSRARQTFTTVSGRSYTLTFNVVTAAPTLLVDIGTTVGDSNVLASGNLAATGAKSFVFVAQGTTTHIELENGSNASPVIDNVSVRELPGNHAFQATSASRPVLRARYNQLTYSEQFDDAGWTKTGSTVTANAAVAPDGTTTADKVAESSTASVVKYIFTTSGISVVGGSFVGTVYAKAAERSRLVMAIYNGSNYQLCQFDLIAGTVVQEAAAGIASIQDAGNGWWRCQVTRTIGATTTYLSIGPFENSNIATLTGGFPSYTGITGEGILIWGAQLLTAADQTSTGGAYQRIAAATDYDTSNPVFRPYLAFDGSDDSFGTSAIDFSGTDEVTVFAGVTKLSDAARGIVVELSATAANAGGFNLTAPDSAAANYAFILTGTTTTVAYTPTTYTAPITNVLSCVYDLGGALIADELKPRIDGVLTQTGGSGSAAGDGNFLNAALFIGRRNNTNLPFNGRIYGLTVLGRTATAAELASMEAWVAGKTGVTL